jgi:hypothetical protein
MKKTAAFVFLLSFLHSSLSFSLDVISPEAAASRLNKSQTVRGVISDVALKRDSCLLLMWPNSGAPGIKPVFQVCIPERYYNDFPSVPVVFFPGKTIEVTGKIHNSPENVPEIEVRAVRNIKVLGDKVTTNETKALKKTPVLISWKALGQNVGKTVTLMGVIKFFEKDPDGATYLGFESPTAAAVIPPDKVASFYLTASNDPGKILPDVSSEPGRMFMGKRVRMTGIVSNYGGKVVVMLNGMDQLEIKRKLGK